MKAVFLYKDPNISVSPAKKRGWIQTTFHLRANSKYRFGILNLHQRRWLQMKQQDVPQKERVGSTCSLCTDKKKDPWHIKRRLKPLSNTPFSLQNVRHVWHFVLHSETEKHAVQNLTKRCWKHTESFLSATQLHLRLWMSQTWPWRKTGSLRIILEASLRKPKCGYLSSALPGG